MFLDKRSALPTSHLPYRCSQPRYPFGPAHIAQCHLAKGDAGDAFGLEIDTDGIAFCLSSAQTATGWDWSDVRRLAHKASGLRGCAYMHVCEASVAGAAPHDRSSVAKAVAHIIVDFIRGHQSVRARL